MKQFSPQKQFSRSQNQVREFKSQNDAVRVISLGGFADVTQNMFVYEYAPSGDFKRSQIIIVDVGVGFPEEDAFGVDMQIPDTHYLVERKDRIKGIFITHGHEDHIGALRFVLPILGKNLPIYAPKLAAALIEARLSEFDLRPNLTVYDDSLPITAGPFIVDPIRVTHSIPDTFHFAITTPIGVFYHGSDFKFDIFPIYGQPSDLNHIGRVGDAGVLCLLSDCLGSDHVGFSPPERSIADNFKQQIVGAKGRVFVTTISSNIVRWGQAIEYGKSVGRKIVVVGFSVDRAISLAKELGYLDISSSDLVDLARAKNFRDNQLLFLVAGFAGQPDSALSKMVMGKHRIKIKAGDKVIFSSPDYIPGTTSKINEMIDNLSRLGADVIYGEKSGDIHVSGHAYQSEHGLLISLLKPKYLLPIGGNARHIKSYQSVAEDLGYRPEQVISPEIDSAVTFTSSSFDTKLRLNLRKILIDGLGVGDVGTTVLRDRKVLAEDGMFSFVLLVDKATGKLAKEPTLLSRGFVFAKENTDLLDYLKAEIKKKFDELTSQPANFDFIREKIQGFIEDLIYQKTGRQPMVLPLVIEV